MNEDHISDSNEKHVETSPVDEFHPKASSISAIDKGSVHKICSGQVVLTLATAVKELVENSVDAGATIVEIKLREHGTESIEVSDNGVGVEEENFQGLTLKHHTSKLQNFADLTSVDTFGFRGEALSSLCALGDMCVTTRHKSSPVGTKLEFDHHGNITSRSAQARQIGTTVVIQNLFSTLPVRHKEFQRNIKKEFAKMVQVLNSYCIISTGVRVTCTNQSGKGNRSTVISTKGNLTLRENIANIFGPKQLQGLLEFQQKSPGEDVCSEFGVKTLEQYQFRLEGYISKCEHGQGRSSTDRQFFFINGRPFDSTKLSKVVNEVYHQYNRHQYPFVVLTVNMEKESVDVNVTPDKRQVFLEGETMILAVVKASLVSMFEPTTSFLQLQMPNCFQKSGLEVKAQGLDEKTSPRKTQSLSSLKDSGISSLLKLKRTFSSAFAKDSPVASRVSESKDGVLPKERKLDSFVTCKKSDVFETGSDILNNSSSSKQVADNDRINAFTGDSSVSLSSDSGLSVGSSTETDRDSYSASSQETVTSLESFPSERSISLTFHSHTAERDCEQTTPCVLSDDVNEENSSCGIDNLPSRTEFLHGEISMCDTIKLASETGCKINGNDSLRDSAIDDHESNSRTCSDSSFEKRLNEKQFSITVHKTSGDTDNNLENSIEQQSIKHSRLKAGDSSWPKVNDHSGFKMETVKTEEECSIILHQLDEKHEVKRKEQKITFSTDRLREHIAIRKGKGGNSEEILSRNFRATISPTDNQAAEQELRKEIKKEMFEEMEILGQFNLGFIITKLGQDLFIVDQHATDEKYNFECLQKDTVIQSQKLICPLNLELTASNEAILIDNLEIFKKNGFDFIVDEEGLPTQRVKLISTPVSKNWNFGKEDIEEMIFMLTDSPGVTCRPTRVRQMFASRACRKSVMIGTALNKAEMKKLVCHMGEIEQPWNCPHGRPTMRHLINLNMLPQ